MSCTQTLQNGVSMPQSKDSQIADGTGAPPRCGPMLHIQVIPTLFMYLKMHKYIRQTRHASACVVHV